MSSVSIPETQPVRNSISSLKKTRGKIETTIRARYGTTSKITSPDCYSRDLAGDVRVVRKCSLLSAAAKGTANFYRLVGEQVWRGNSAASSSIQCYNGLVSTWYLLSCPISSYAHLAWQIICESWNRVPRLNTYYIRGNVNSGSVNIVNFQEDSGNRVGKADGNRTAPRTASLQKMLGGCVCSSIV